MRLRFAANLPRLRSTSSDGPHSNNQRDIPNEPLPSRLRSRFRRIVTLRHFVLVMSLTLCCSAFCDENADALSKNRASANSRLRRSLNLAVHSDNDEGIFQQVSKGSKTSHESDAVTFVTDLAPDSQEPYTTNRFWFLRPKTLRLWRIEFANSKPNSMK